MMGWSIRWRLTLWNLLAVAMLLFGFAALVYGLVSHALYEKTDQDLLAGARLLEQDQRMASDGKPSLKYLIEELHDHENLACAAFTSGGAVITRTEALATDSIPPYAPGIDGHSFRDLRLPIIGRQRALVTHAPVGRD